MFYIEIPVRQNDLEPIYEHLNHGRVFGLFEQARLQMLIEMGLPQALLLSRGEFLVVSALGVEYLREIKGETYKVSCQDGKIERRKVARIHQDIINSRGKICVSADIELMLIDKKIGRSAAFPEDFVSKFNAFFERFDSLPRLG